MADSYFDFATVYDALMDNVPYDDWFTYLHGLLKEYKIENGIIAELGCGTGSMTERLARAGYDMIGIDNSISMLDIANEKKADNSLDILYLCQDMREYELYGTVDAVVSLCDSINYIDEPEDLLEVFRLTNNYLETDGIFIFDFHPRYYYETIVANRTIAEDREDMSFIWDNYFDAEDGINELALSLFIREGYTPGERSSDEDTNVFHKYQELHIQRGYTLAEMLDLVEQSGLILLGAYDAFTHNPATEECERIYIIAKEHTETGAKKELSEQLHRTN